MAPELFNVGAEGKSGLSTRESDVFALGMVTFEVRNVYIRRSSRGLKLPLPSARYSLGNCHSQSVMLRYR